MFRPVLFSFMATLGLAALGHAEDAQQPSNGSAQVKKGKEEIALRDNNDNHRLYNKEINRGNWDYRENWRYDRDAYLSGMNQSQFNDSVYPRYGYGSYGPNYGVYGVGYNAGYNNVPAGTFYGSASGYQTAYPNNNYYASYPQYGSSTYSNYYPQYGSSTYGYYPQNVNQYHYGYQTIYPDNSYYASYPQYGSSTYSYYPQYGYGNYSITPQYGYGAGYPNSIYGDSYYRDYRNDYYGSYPGASMGVYNTNQPSSSYPYYNAQPSSTSYNSYEFPGKTDMPYMPSARP